MQEDFIQLQYNGLLFLRNLTTFFISERFKHWNFDSNNFQIEPVPVGSDPLPENCDDFSGQSSCFATTYFLGTKLQIVDLMKEGFSQKLLDENQPIIVISDW